MTLAVQDDGWRLSDARWAQLKPLLPVYHPPAHPLGCHRRRIDDRAVMEGILFGWRTGCPWNALNATGIGSSRTTHRRCLEWTEAGVFTRFWQAGLLQYADLKGIDWSWLSLGIITWRANGLLG